MSNQVVWMLHLNTYKKDAADKLLLKVQEALGREVKDIFQDIYYKDGNWRVCFITPLISNSWDSQVVETLGLAQKLSYQWSLLGEVEHLSLEGVTDSQFRISGLTWISFLATKKITSSKDSWLEL